MFFHFLKKYHKSQANKNVEHQKKNKTKMKNKTFAINVSPSELFICMLYTLFFAYTRSSYTIQLILRNE